jgi:hypothetical protein
MFALTGKVMSVARTLNQGQRSSTMLHVEGDLRREDDDDSKDL